MKLKFDKHTDLYPVPSGCVLKGGDHITDSRMQRYVVPHVEDAIEFSLYGCVVSMDTGRIIRLNDLHFPIIVEALP